MVLFSRFNDATNNCEQKDFSQDCPKMVESKITRRLNVIVLDEEIPFPLNSGKRIRSFNLFQRLARLHNITYLAYCNQDSEETSLAAREFGRIGIETIVVDRPVPKKSGFGFYGRLAGNLFSTLPYSVWTHTSQSMRTALVQQQKARPVDLLHCEWTPYAEMMRNVEGKVVTVSAHNIESQIWQRYHETEQNPLKRAYIHHQWKKFQRYERWAFARANRTIFVSEPDAEIARLSFGATRTAIVDNGVDVSTFTPSFDGREPRRLLIMGSLDWRPNVDGINRFLESVFPKVLTAQPHARLIIVGRNPESGWAHKIRQHKNVELFANVADVRPYVTQAGTLVVPLRIGGGSRLKILEAAASGLPVVSTMIGAEGLDFVPGQHFSASENIEDLVQPIVDSIREPQAAKARAKEAYKVILQNYNWDTLAERMDRIWRAELANEGGST